MVPQGLQYKRERNNTVIKHKNKQSFGFILFLFAIIWSSISFYAIYGTQYEENKLDILRSIFGLPFILASFFIFFFSLKLIFGKTVITINSKQLSFKNSLLGIGKNKVFRWSEIQEVKLESLQIKTKTASRIYIKGTNKTHHLNYLNPEAQKFILEKINTAKDLYGNHKRH